MPLLLNSRIHPSAAQRTNGAAPIQQPSEQHSSVSILVLIPNFIIERSLLSPACLVVRIGRIDRSNTQPKTVMHDQEPSEAH
jgi:hypothetical protein